MQLTIHQRHACCSQHATAAIHHHYLAGFLAAAVTLAAMFGIVRSIDAYLWGEAYKPRIVSIAGSSALDADTAARYQEDKATQFKPISGKILDR